MSIKCEEVPSLNPLKDISSTDGYPMADSIQLKSAYPLGTILDAFVTNVHNVPQLRFFMFVKKPENTQHFASVRYASTPPNAYKCLRMPREGYVFALRLETTMVRAVRLRTMCITTTREVFLPDIGRNETLNEDESDMYHLPLNLRTPPGLAILCQLRGVNDDVTILPDNMRTFLRGLLFRSVKLRVDGYIGGILKVQLLHVTYDELIKWTSELGKEEHDFPYALKHIILYKSKHNDRKSLEASRFLSLMKDKLSPIPELSSSSDDETYGNDKNNLYTNTISTPSTPSILPSPSSSDSWSFALEETVIPMASPTGKSSASSTDMIDLKNDVPVEKNDGAQDKMISLDLQDSSENVDYTTAEKLGLRPLLGRSIQVRPVLGAVNIEPADNSWKRDVLPALVVIDNRQKPMNFSRDELLTITPTYIGELERFFGIVHRRNEPYMQHMWTENEIPWSSRFTGLKIPYIFDIVLAKHSGDFKWYRAKVIEISKEQRKVLVFFVDYGGVEYIDLMNIANMSDSIAKMPFQVVLFRLSDLIDVTTTKAERSFGVEFLRTLLLKKTLTVRVVKYSSQEITICFEDQRFSHIPPTLIRKGFMKHLGNM